MSWDERPSPVAAIRDHETNPEYELHVGQVTIVGDRRVSIWLCGERWSGWLQKD